MSEPRLECVIVSHTHWDREWYRTFEAFRARLVDTVDRVLELVAADPGWCFVLDGQAVVLEDYLAVRPDRRDDLAAAVRAGRLGIGPWYVQPDSLLPSGESHVRNLLEGRRVCDELGPVSRVAYTPDSFGHPGQLPQLFAGFGLAPFIYWRGNGNELDRLGSSYTWVGADGSRLPAVLLGAGYFAAAYLPDDIDAAATRLGRVARRLAAAGDTRILLPNGVDHAPPEPRTGAIAEALAAATGWTVTRGLFDDFAAGLAVGAGEYRGELLGGRTAALLPGVWSTRLYLKLADRAAEAALVGWAEPFAALAARLGADDETPALRAAWRSLLVNQAHDSICGCSADAVHDQMLGRYATATELADQTTRRCLERLAGASTVRPTPWADELDLAVFNPSPFPRTDVVRFALDGLPTFQVTDDNAAIHPLAIASLLRRGFTVDGAPARLVPSTDVSRFRVLAEQRPADVEFVLDVPAMGWRRARLAPGDAAPDTVDGERSIDVAGTHVSVAEEGTLEVTIGSRTFTGLAGVEDVADKGDTYDFDPLPGDEPITRPRAVRVERRVHEATGIAEVRVERTFDLPAALTADRASRTDETVEVVVTTIARLVPGVERVDLDVRIDNAAADHRLRLLFPTGGPVHTFTAATTFGTALRTTELTDATGWVHPAPTTFPHHGWIAANGLTVAAPGLPEGEVSADGTIAVTIVRAVGWLSRMDLGRRPIQAGPALVTPGAQCLGPLIARLSLFAGPAEPATIRAAELGLRAVPAGDGAPLLASGASALTVAGDGVELTTLKPAQDGPGLIVRVLNPTEHTTTATLTFAFDVGIVSAARLDETPDPTPELDHDRGTVRLRVDPHTLRTLRID